MIQLGLIKAYGINYRGAILKIKKSQDYLQPIYEAFTNAYEAIKLLNKKPDNEKICIKIYFRKDLFTDQDERLNFESISIEDTGVGFNDIEFERFINLDDTSKPFFNKGSGRIQYIHSFEKTHVISIYKDETSKTGFKRREFILSKKKAFLDKNAIINHISCEDVDATETFTELIFSAPLKDNFNEVNIDILKENIKNRYLALFCENRSCLPKIILQQMVNEILTKELYITKDDIPQVDKEKKIKINFCKIASDGKGIEQTDKIEIFELKGFKINKAQLDKNGIKLVSKGEIAQDLKLENLLSDEELDGYRYLFLLSGDYISNKDTDTRGCFIIPTKDEFKKEANLFNEEEILLDDLQEKVNETILFLYDEIGKRKEKKQEDVEKLQRMFLLSPELIKEAKIRLNDTEEDILEKVYKADAKLVAKKDAEIKKKIDALDNLDPNSQDFTEQLNHEIDDLTREIPLQNKTALTRYVAHRKLILSLFDKVLKRQLIVQNGGKRNEDEKLLHNLIFRQKTDESSQSDLWLLNEDFVYFKGTSEGKLGDIEIDGNKIMKQELSEEELNYRDSLEEKRYEKRPDILLFPQEGKCIIIELKNPDKNISDHLLQINNYASIIRNLSNPEFNFNTFYGYLIGDKLDADDIQNKDSAFVNAYNFDYVFKPYYRILGRFGREDGSLYTEAITYSTLLDRASKRNELFIDKLLGTISL